jgi:hypothetical protein
MSTGSRPLVAMGSTQCDGETALKRKILRKTFRPSTKRINGIDIKSTAGPFRTSMNLGDFLSRQYQSCGGCNQVNDVNSRIIRPKMGGGISNNSCNVVTNGVTPKELPLKGGNIKYVADSSLYTRFKDLDSINSNYYDIKFGGVKTNGTYLSNSYGFIQGIQGPQGTNY